MAPMRKAAAKKVSKKVMKKKAPKAKKAMKKKAKRVSKIAKGKFAKSAVWRGNKEKTYTGLKKTDLVKSKTGKIVSKKQSLNAKKRYANGIGKWNKAVQKARSVCKTTGFVAIGGKSKEGQALYKKAQEYYKLEKK